MEAHKMANKEYVISEAGVQVLGFLTKYKFYEGEPTVIDGKALGISLR